ncbi:hypothetical protein KIN20_018656 [Parelaphostrongylus tenuis]|uniref:Uncharacterized protein n=1 Tax=Parelaphostrongylus tenuis TaxID=148309 RepID=A0AAD5N1B7_PARTN|nr:hypothetical protein KIN20_018656 [Parelaphostrongylus tenuis]
MPHILNSFGVLYDMPLIQALFIVLQAWDQLEKAEHERELALKEEIIRQEKLEQLATRFNRKAEMRETWLTENQRLVSQDNFGNDLASVEVKPFVSTPDLLLLLLSMFHSYYRELTLTPPSPEIPVVNKIVISVFFLFCYSLEQLSGLT